MQHPEIPPNITTSATSLLAPYFPDLTATKLLEALTYNPNESLRSRYEAKEALRISMPTLDRMLAENELTRVTIRGRVFIKQSEIDAIIKGKVGV